MELKPQQQQAMAVIGNFLNDDTSVFILKGYAGTGKTTLISSIIEAASAAGMSIQLMAPTGRAAKILSDKTGYAATTIHKCIYELSKIEAVEGDEKTESKIEYRFPIRQLRDTRNPGMAVSPDRSLLIVDEASMISSRKSIGDLFVFGTGVLLDDLINYSRIKEGGKILFVGDPAQLPPVGDPNSFALDEAFFQNKGISVSYFELSEVLRQDKDSAIFNNSMKFRTILQSGIKTELIMDRKDGEVEDIDSADIAARFCELSPVPEINGPVVICYSNNLVSSYNGAIRNLYYPNKVDNIQIGDKLVVVSNNYSSETRIILNGEFATVVDIADSNEIQSGYVYVDEGTEKNKRVRMDLSFRDVSLLFEDGMIVRKKLFEPLLFNSHPNITYQEQCALMSNFCIRHRGLKANSQEFNMALMRDPYYSAVMAKFGYAITCHKAQGGEWDTTFVDFHGRSGLDKDCLRWAYTAVTRASHKMYGCAMYNIPQLQVKVTGIVSSSTVPVDFYPSDASVQTGPFSRDTDPVSLKSKYWSVSAALEGTAYHISDIEHKSYREVYVISDVEGHTFRCDSMYNAAGVMKWFKPVNPEETPDEILNIINNAPALELKYSYEPSNINLERLYRKIKSVCDSSGIGIVNVIEHLNNYKVLYCLKTDADFAVLEVCVNGHGEVTYITPRSEKGSSDAKLSELVEVLKQ